MLLSVRICSQAWKSVDAISTYLTQRASLSTARRFVKAFQKAITALQRIPQLGSNWPTDNAKLLGVRYWTLSKPFQRYIIFYRLAGLEGIEIIDVIHGSQDIGPRLST